LFFLKDPFFKYCKNLWDDNVEDLEKTAGLWAEAFLKEECDQDSCLSKSLDVKTPNLLDAVFSRN